MEIQIEVHFPEYKTI